jgi:hypothetical protein
MLSSVKNCIPSTWKAKLRHIIYLNEFRVKRSLTRRMVAQQISRIDKRTIPLSPELELRGFMVVRNESLRLPFMLRYYFERGIDRIFVLDNDSSDNTQSIVLSFDNTHLFHTKDIYAHQATWIDLLLRRYGVGYWCLVADADEMLIYPDCETVSLRQLCNFLDRESFTALDCVLLDMYPDRALSKIKYEQGTDPLQIASWFDSPSYCEGFAGMHYLHDQNIFYEGLPRLFGGVRKRAFDANPCLSKVPLVRFDNSVFLSPGAHFIQGARLADLRGALLHFKYLDDFPQNVKQEVMRGQRSFGNDLEYNRYLAALSRFPDLCLHADLSVRFSDSAQLVNLGIMKRSRAYGSFIEEMSNPV